MAPILIDKIISVSSESVDYHANNLLLDKKWLTNPKDACDTAIVEFAFDKPMEVHYIDIGFINVATMDVLVGSSKWLPSREYVNLVPAVSFQTSLDARSERNKHGCKMFNYREHMNHKVADKPWDRVRLILRQPYARKKQMGLEFVRFGTPANGHPPVDAPKCTSHVSSPMLDDSSPFAKLRNKIKNSQTANTPITSTPMLKRLFGNEGKEALSPAMGRTAKMLIAAKLNSSKTSPQNNDPTTPKKIQSPVKRKIDLQDVHEPPRLSTKTAVQVHQSPPERDVHSAGLLRVLPNEKIAGHSSSAAPSLSPANKLEQCKAEPIAVLPDADRVNSVGTSSNEVSKIDLATKHEVAVHRSHAAEQDSRTSEDVFPAENQDSELVANDSLRSADGQESSEPEYTEKQIKSLKKAIKRFFNTLDMDTFDVSSLRLRDLRKRFEKSHGVKLNTGGRNYFKEVTSRFVEIILAAERHKRRQGDNDGGSLAVKRKPESNTTQHPSDSVQSPYKMPRRDFPRSHAASVRLVQCPLCMEHFSEATIEDHAALCGESEETSPHSHVHQAFDDSTGSVVDCSENSCLSKNEQQKWIEFSRQPKPYQERLNCSQFAGCTLVKCPSCGQKYKVSEIELHCNECMDKVNSGYTKMGLYFVRKGNNTLGGTTGSRKESRDDPIRID